MGNHSEKLITPTEAARQIGISPDVLRLWSQDGYFGPWLDAPRTPSGHRRYTQRDLAICGLIKRWHEADRLSYPDIRQRFEAHGADRCLQMSLGSDAHNEVLQEETERLRRELADLQLEKGQLQDAKVALEHEKAFVQRQWDAARAATVVAAQGIDAKRLQAERELEWLEHAQRRAIRHLQEAQEALTRMGIWSWLTGGRQRALVHVQEARVEYEEATERLNVMRQTLEQISMAHLREVLGLPSGEVAADAETKLVAEEEGEETE